MTHYSHKEFHDTGIAAGITPDNPAYKSLHYGLGRWIIDRFKPSATLEIGCGVGTLLEYLLDHGVRSIGMDINPYEKSFFEKRNFQWAAYYFLRSLGEYNTDVPGCFDLLISIECFEHIADEDILKAMPYLARNCRHFLFSSSPQKEGLDPKWGHINIKTEEEWTEFFSPWFVLDSKLHNPTPWTLLFKSKLC